MVTLIYGNEPYNIQYVKDSILQDHDGLSAAVYSEWNSDSELFASQVPIFSEKSVLILEMDRLGADDELLAYLKEPNDLCDLYIIADAVDKNTKIYKELKAHHSIQEMNKISRDVMAKWVGKQLTDMGCTMKTAAYELFLERIRYWDDPDCNLFTVKNYLIQLGALNTAIDTDTVIGFVPETVDEKIFSLSTYLFEKDERKVYRAAVQLLADKENPIAMLSAILRTFRLAYKSSLFPDVKAAEKGKLFGAPAFQYAAALQYKPAVLKKCMSEIQDAVRSIKSGYPGDKVFITTLGRLCNEICAS